MTKSIHEKVRLTRAQVRNLPAFRRARKAIFKFQIEEDRVHGRGRTLILTPSRAPRLHRVRARRSPASLRRASADSGGSADSDGGDPEPPRPLLYSLSPYAGGAI